KWASENKILTEHKAEKLRLKNRKDRLRWLSQEEENHLLEVASLERNPFRKTRNQAIIYTMLLAGLRIEEVSLLEYKSMDYGDLVIYEDGEKKRTIPIQSKLQLKLLEWMKYRSQSPKKFHQDSSFLFVTERSGHMQPRSIQFVIERFSAR